MSRFEAQNYIVTNGLVLNLDAGDPDSYTRSQPPYVEVLVVAGGGSGGTSNPSNGGGAGGGAGGVIYNSAYQLTNASAITVTIGAGGAGQTSDTTQGNDGSNSVFGSLTAVGGGGGGSASGGNTNGGNGGSGGGAGYVGYYNNFNSGTGTAGQGFRGGYVLANNNAGGGGGAGGVGGNTFDSRPEPGYPGGSGGTGGPGVTYSISGTSTLYSNGGNGGSNSANTIVNGSGTTGTYGDSSDSSTAGSGIVIVRYPGLPAATGGTITYLNGYTIHTFTTSGTFTPYKWNSTSDSSQFNVNNGTPFIPYIFGGTFDLDGTDDYFSTGSLNLQQSWTLEIWANMDDDTSFGLFGQGTFATNQGLHILYQSSTRGMIFAFYSNDNDYMNNYRPSPATGAWYHWVFTYNVSTYDKQFYADSVLQTPAASTENAYAGSGQFNIGAIYSNALSPANGKIAVSRFYNRVLSQAEITQNYNAQKSRFGL